jgi:hypothetical protein
MYLFISTDIDKVLMKINEVASNQDRVATEEPLILRGCDKPSFLIRDILEYSFPDLNQANSRFTKTLSNGSTLPLRSIPLTQTPKKQYVLLHIYQLFVTYIPSFLGPSGRNRRKKTQPVVYGPCS